LRLRPVTQRPLRYLPRFFFFFFLFLFFFFFLFLFFFFFFFQEAAWWA
jgi:hypothetical protein